DLNYTPINLHNATADINDQAVWVHVADNVDGDGLGATGKQGDGFLAGDWETVAAFTLADDDKFFEGKINEDAANTHEWGDDDDKVGLLVKLNVLGSDSASNLQVINNSTASDAGSGKGARTIRVGAKVSTFISALDFFLLGADIDIVDSNTAPTVQIFQPNGVGDTANASYSIKYTLKDPDDDISTGGLLAALYFSEHGDLASVQDVKIFGTKIVDENDNSTVFASGTNDFTEAANETYLWDNPPAALKAKLFASIFQTRSGTYFIYLVADDQKNPPVFARSPGPVTILHKPIVEYVDPAGIDTVDTGVRSGHLANPYDLDFFVRDFDLQGAGEVQLFFSAVSGLSSVSISGFYPNQNFVLGKSLSGTRATAIENSDTLTTGDVEFSWDLTDSVCATSVCAPGDSSIVREGFYFLYAVANDSVNTTVGRSNGHVIVKHSPQFTFYDPPRDSHRRINTGSQPVFTIQWQKGSGDKDFDDDATIDLYFTTDNPATINYEDFPDSLLKDADTKTIVKGLREDGDAGNDMYVWDFRNLPADVATDGQKVWTYAVISDGHGNKTEELGGALTIYHSPFITLSSADLDNLNSFDKNDALRITWDDYLVDDGASTDDAYIRLYAAESPSSFATLDVLDSAVDGISTFLINSSDGSQFGTLQTIRESDENFFDWNTALFGNEGTDYDIYAATSEDPGFSQTVGGIQLSRSSSPLSMGTGVAKPNVTLSPTDQAIAIGDTFTFDVMIQNSTPINLVQIVMNITSTDFLVIDQDAIKNGRQPFIDLDNVFAGATAIENAFDLANLQLRFAKSSFGGQLVGTVTEPVALARFQLAALRTLGSPPSLTFHTSASGTAFGQVGNSDLLYIGSGINKADPELTRTRRGIISATVELEGRTVPPASFNHQTHLDVHLRVPGSTIDITDAEYIARHDTLTSTA
ncbi:MAG: hypothetical protein O3B95_13210, partial [Chloroflexi bacterium]|nr:hypothetical protein [Chloroflexota bacterium]